MNTLTLDDPGRYLYHVTWRSNLDSILEQGLIPNKKPNPWCADEIRDHSKRGVFLCEDKMVGCWMRRLYYIRQYQTHNERVVCLRVDCQRLSLYRDPIPSGKNYFHQRTIRPKRLSPINLDPDLFTPDALLRCNQQQLEKLMLTVIREHATQPRSNRRARPLPQL